MPTIGVLALQGDFAAHRRMLDRIGCVSCEVRRPDQLRSISGLIIPGGESTTLLKLIAAVSFEAALREFHAAGRPIFGTCAGIILLAADVTNPHQHSFGLLDVSVERNSYGRQIDSFESSGPFRADDEHDSHVIDMVFIRAPRITRVGSEVAVLARHADEPVLVASRGVWGATFHPEMTDDSTVHQAFVQFCAQPQPVVRSSLS